MFDWLFIHYKDVMVCAHNFHDLLYGLTLVDHSWLLFVICRLSPVRTPGNKKIPLIEVLSDKKSRRGIDDMRLFVDVGFSNS